jgi:hypothetical protein
MYRRDGVNRSETNQPRRGKWLVSPTPKASGQQSALSAMLWLHPVVRAIDQDAAHAGRADQLTGQPCYRAGRRYKPTASIYARTVEKTPRPKMVTMKTRSAAATLHLHVCKSPESYALLWWLQATADSNFNLVQPHLGGTDAPPGLRRSVDPLSRETHGRCL